MRMQSSDVNSEYIEELCKSMLEWVKDDEAFTVPQFLQHEGIGYPFLKYILHTFPIALNTFEVMKAILCNRWFHHGWISNDLPAHKQKMLLKYLRLYDSHERDIEDESKEQAAIAASQVALNYQIEQFGKEDLNEKYKKIYELNDKKRQSDSQD
jgi:cell division protein FtsB